MNAWNPPPDDAPPFPVDAVLTWVDGDDPAHRAKRRAFCGPAAGGCDGVDGPGPERWYQGVGEITASVRSLVRRLPWIRTVHVVTDTQTPPVDAELLASGRVRVVDHEAIIPAAYRPVFASTIIESFLHRIPGLSPVWLYGNDDLFHFAPAPPRTFLRECAGGGVALRLHASLGVVRRLLSVGGALTPPVVPRTNPYTEGVARAFRVLRERAGVAWPEVLVPRHVTQVYRTSTARRIEDEYGDVLHATRSLRFRSRRQLSWGTLAYTLERRWHPEDEVCLWRPFDRSGEVAFFDFLHCREPGTAERRWEAVERSGAPLACVNNVPAFERERFWRAVGRQGLGGPLGAGPAAAGTEPHRPEHAGTGPR